VAVDAPSSSVMRPIADAVAKGECILFLGAGVHYPPPAGSSYVYPEEHRPPLGAALSEALARDCDFAKRLPNESPTNLQRVALCYELQHSRKRLVDEVRRAVQTGKRPSSVLCALAELDFPFVVTTNYHQLFERALTAAGKEPRLSIYSPELRATEDHGPPTADSPGRRGRSAARTGRAPGGTTPIAAGEPPRTRRAHRARRRSSRPACAEASARRSGPTRGGCRRRAPSTSSTSTGASPAVVRPGRPLVAEQPGRDHRL
jgi:hypothetical protein